MAILSNGGASIVAVDECEKQGISLAELSRGTKEKSKKVIPEFVSASNPIDTTGTVSFTIYSEAIKALAALIRHREFLGRVKL